jgi:hypothetical protein
MEPTTSTDTKQPYLLGTRRIVFSVVLLLGLITHSLFYSYSHTNILTYVPGSASQQNQMHETQAGGGSDDSISKPSSRLLENKTNRCVPPGSTTCSLSTALLPPSTSTIGAASSNLLDVPFYLYEELVWSDNATLSNMGIRKWMDTRPLKHTDDWWFMISALKHPMRTRKPGEAKLFVVPALLNEIAAQESWDKKRLCFKGMCNKGLLAYTDKVLADSPWFQRHQGRDHIVVASHYASDSILFKYTNLANCNMIGFEARDWNAPSRAIMPSLYVGQPCEHAKKNFDFSLIASLKPKFRERRDICRWMHENRSEYTMPICGRGEQCPTLALAKFGFHVRGDTYGANRLMDTMLSGTVPIFTQEKQYDILPDWIDWSKVSYFADVTNQTAFLEAIDNILADQQGYEEKLATLLENQGLFDWTTLTPFDTYMFMLSRHLWPDTSSTETSTPYSALILSKPDGFRAFGPPSKFK